MDFKLVLQKLLAAFDQQNITYALMGGFALAVWGVPRTTVDLDFLVLREDLVKVDKIMMALGYELRHQTENVSQYVAELRIFGEVDFLHAFRAAARAMFTRAVDKEIFGGTARLKVLAVEDLIGMKVQAMANDERRRPLDRADIEALLELHGAGVDWGLVEEYFELFHMQELLRELKEKYGQA